MSEQQTVETPRQREAAETSGTWHDVFFYRRILRAGWGLGVFLLLTIVLVAVQTLALRSVPRLRDAPHTVLVPHDALGNLVALFAVAVATAVVTLLEQRRYGDFGFGGTGKIRLLVGGLASGAAVLAALVLLLHGLGLAVFRGETLFGAAAQWRLGLIWAAFFVLVALVEELLLRGYLLFGLTRAIASLLRTYFGARSGVGAAFWIAGTLLSLVYGLLHGLNYGETALGVLSTVFLGLVLVWSLWRTGSLWWAFGFHVAWDWMQSYIFGTADTGVRTRDHVFYTEPLGPSWKSGGTAGPEGSIFMFGALAAMLGLTLLLKRRQVYPDLWVEAEMDAPEDDPLTLPDPGRVA